MRGAFRGSSSSFEEMGYSTIPKKRKGIWALVRKEFSNLKLNDLLRD